MVGTLLSFCGAAFVLAMIPGPSTAVIVRQALRGGRRAGFATIAANELGVLFWACAAALGASALVTASELAFAAMRWAGAAVLVVLGIQSILGKGPSDALGDSETPATSAATGWSSFRVGLLTILTNPKAAVFAASFLPQFLPADAPPLPTMLLLAVLWMVVDSMWFIALVLSLGRVRVFMGSKRVRRNLERVSGTILVGLGVRLAL